MFWLILFLIPNFLCAEVDVFFVYGASCSGKSSLSRVLKSALGEKWRVVERDDVEDQYSEATPDEVDYFFIKEIEDNLNLGFRVIADSQYPLGIPEIRLVYIFVYAPLDVLIARDEVRNERLNRGAQRRRWARAFVIDSYAKLLTFERFDTREAIPVNFISFDLFQFPIQQETRDFFYQLENNSHNSIYSSYYYDFFINSSEISLIEAQESIINSYFLR